MTLRLFLNLALLTLMEAVAGSVSKGRRAKETSLELQLTERRFREDIPPHKEEVKRHGLRETCSRPTGSTAQRASLVICRSLRSEDIEIPSARCTSSIAVIDLKPK